MSTLWHYTCDHGRAAIGERGELLPLVAQLSPDRYSRGKAMLGEMVGMLEMIWLTDLQHPIADALGLTRNTIGCDRTKYRYRVSNPEDGFIHRYFAIRRSHFTPTMRLSLESAPGAMPMHWWVALAPVEVVYDPVHKEEK